MLWGSLDMVSRENMQGCFKNDPPLAWGPNMGIQRWLWGVYGQCLGFWKDVSLQSCV
jgi:hypothetical protein